MAETARKSINPAWYYLLTTTILIVIIAAEMWVVKEFHKAVLLVFLIPAWAYHLHLCAIGKTPEEAWIEERTELNRAMLLAAFDVVKRARERNVDQ